MNQTVAIWLMATMWLVACGCGSRKPVPGATCHTFEDCGAPGDAVCIDGRCRVFDNQAGHGNAVVALSFHRDLHEVAASGVVRFIHHRTASGSGLRCEDILQGTVNLASAEINPLHAQPKYLVFHWTGGDGFFPDNLVQFIRPAEDVLAVAEGFELLNREGDLTAIGCTEGQTIVKGQDVELVIQLVAP